MTCDDPFAPLPESRPVRLMKAERCQCRWPLGDPRAKEFRFCGAESIIGSSYCLAHKRMSRGEGTPSERSAHKVVAA